MGIREQSGDSMKHLLTIFIMLFSMASVAQEVDTESKCRIDITYDFGTIDVDGTEYIKSPNGAVMSLPVSYIREKFKSAISVKKYELAEDGEWVDFRISIGFLGRSFAEEAVLPGLYLKERKYGFGVSTESSIGETLISDLDARAKKLFEETLAKLVEKLNPSLCF